MADVQRTITKVLGGQEDLLFGEGTVQQARSGGLYEISKIRGFYPCNSQEELDDLDPVLFPKALLVSDNSYKLYKWDTGAWVQLYEAELYSRRTVNTLADAATDLNLSAGSYFVTANAAPTTISTVSNAVVGLAVYVEFDGNTTIEHNSAIALKLMADETPVTGVVKHFICRSDLALFEV